MSRLTDVLSSFLVVLLAGSQGTSRLAPAEGDRLASFVVANRTIHIHEDDESGLRITSNTRGACEMHRIRDQVRIGVGSGWSEATWSFTPSDDAETWTRDVRAVLRGSACGQKHAAQ
jgi:hypothetical protein